MLIKVLCDVIICYLCIAILLQMKLKRLISGMALIGMCLPVMAQRQWTLQECIDYAMANNISLQKSGLQRQSSQEDLRQSKAALLPSLNFSTSQSVNYRPWPFAGQATVTDGQVMMSIDKVYYNGSYSVNGNWTVWNGGRNVNQVKLNNLTMQRNEMDSITTAKNIEEQIAMLFIQTLYTKENVSVQKATLENAQRIESRGKDMYDVGKISKADLMQLTAQRAQDEYNVVQAESQVNNYKRQLKALLQITSTEEFDIADIDATDAMALAQIPGLQNVYELALANRPEFKSLQLSIASADVSRKLATAQRLPTIGMSASVGTSTTSQSDNEWVNQIKSSMGIMGGVNISVPIFDQRQTRTAVNKAEIARRQALLDIKDKQTTLYSTIENYWIQAENYQSQYKAAKVSCESARMSYELLAEQFSLGLKNIAQLMEGKDRLLASQQNELQSKYMAILNIRMLEFYSK